jgi:hypothetical protein
MPLMPLISFITLIFAATSILPPFHYFRHAFARLSFAISMISRCHAADTPDDILLPLSFSLIH